MFVRHNTSLRPDAIRAETGGLQATAERRRLSPGKVMDYLQFVKFRLSATVVFSAVAGFVLGAGVPDWAALAWLVAGGILVTGASNGFNQILERDTDALMPRTAVRPLPKGSMQVTEAAILASVMGISGIAILWYFMNPLCALLGALALSLYTLAYTPLKRKTPFAVFVGAVPGAIPPMLGWVAATGSLGFEAWLLFAIQFIWQFPHFWSIAWVLDDDYRKAGFHMLPSLSGRDRRSSFQVLVYSIGLLPISLLPYWFGLTGPVSAVLIAVCGLAFIFQAARLHATCSMKAATQLMFGSFAYLPVVQIAMMVDKI